LDLLGSDFLCLSSEDDPDYDFLHADLSSSEKLPPLPPGSSLPPALPEKRRCSTTGKDTPDSPVCPPACVCLSSPFLFCPRRSLRERTPADLTAAKSTFQLLVRVVDNLSVVELESDLLLLLIDLVFRLLIGGELGMAHVLHSNVLSKMEKRWKLIDSPQSLRPLAAKGVAAR
ncbi:hypothetical protein XENOCAPTIV_016829, partial [Xenoophorus captivus]